MEIGCSIRVSVCILVHVALLLLMATNKGGQMGFVLGCHEPEREALLEMKRSVVSDPAKRLSSWKGDECCDWYGVTCHNISRHVIGLHLHTDLHACYDGYFIDDYFIDGFNKTRCGLLRFSDLNPALVELKELKYLDLSGNYFNGSRIPELIGSMKNLRYLNLSKARFGGTIPPQLGNLTSLLALDLSFNDIWGNNNFQWLTPLVNLRSLDLSGYSDYISISDSELQSLMQAVTTLPSLLDLRLRGIFLGQSQVNRVFNLTWQSIFIQHLDLSENLMGGQVPGFLSNMSSLNFLALSGNAFNGPLPHFLSNMSSLKSLHLSQNKFEGVIPLWLKNIRLETLDLSYNLFSHIEGGSIIGILGGNLCNLKELYLSGNQLGDDTLSPYYTNQSSKCISYELESLDLSYCNITSTLSYWLSDLKNLKRLYIQGNKINGPIPQSIGNFLSLEELSMADNGLNGTIPSSIGNISSLEHLDLSSNLFEGSLSDLHFLNLSSLYYLDLSHNHLSGPIPTSIGSLSSLQFLDLSSNSFEGFIDDSHLSDLSQLSYLYLSFNLLNFNLSSDWLPKFRLNSFKMSSCRIKGRFPQWIKTQKELNTLDLSNNEIYGELPWWFPSPNLSRMNLSHNQILGPIPHLSSSSHLSSMDLSYNLLFGVVNGSLCLLQNLEFLDLQRNQFSGEIPNCWGNALLLSAMDLSFNRLSGSIPISIGLLSNLAYLKLNNNSLEGGIPLSINIQSQLVILDLGENKLSGEVPNWGADTHPFLTILRLRGNQLKGAIPPRLCSLFNLQLLDLAKNNLTGNIPRCFGQFKSMKSSLHTIDGYIPADYASGPNYAKAPTFANAPDFASGFEAPGPVPLENSEEEYAMVVLKGTERQYTSNLKFVVDLDLSCNGLVGTIPKELVQLVDLNCLNLSYNHLIGHIPENIGEMRSLESLDLSNNQLSGTIPSSLSAITSLSSLNLSCNKLYGQIPSGNQLQTLNDPSIYANNAGLCGNPLPPCGNKNGKKQEQEEEEDEGESKFEKVLFILVIMFGFATGFWGVVGSLLLKKSWRYAFFQSVETMINFLHDKLY